MLFSYLLLIIYKGRRGPNTKSPGIFTWEFHGFLRDFVIQPAST